MSIKNSIQDNEKNRIKYFKKMSYPPMSWFFKCNRLLYKSSSNCKYTVSKYFQYFTMEVSHILRKQIWLPYPF